ncbi:MAG: hypothetical protein U5L00_07715 [Desulfovermiculus sp.]|nr:hypothetical protein [Desulfovermiculus sp.]
MTEDSGGSTAPQNHAQNRTTDSVQSKRKDVRLHVFIRAELEDKLLEEVIKRKKDPKVANLQANKRAIVEEALEYFLLGKENGSQSS